MNLNRAVQTAAKRHKRRENIECGSDLSAWVCFAWPVNELCPNQLLYTLSFELLVPFPGHPNSGC